jgi:heme/copper-type cytochrome/quinol oxidase subunit 2
MSYSDEPNLVKPTRRWSLKTIVAIAVVLVVVGGVLFIPLFQHNLDEAAHNVRRGAHQGALYDITVAGSPCTIELGWIAPAFSAVLTPAPAADTTLEVSGDFGSEALTWDAAENRFGPGKTRLDPYAHAKVKLTLRQADRALWSDTLWLYGVHDTHGHGH